MQAADGQRWRAMVRMPVDRPGLELIPVTDAHRADGSPALTMHVDQILDEWREEGEEPGVEVRFDVDGKSPPLRGAAAWRHHSRLPRREARGVPWPLRRSRPDEKMGMLQHPRQGCTSRTPGALDASGVVTSRITLRGRWDLQARRGGEGGRAYDAPERFSVTVDELEAIAASAAAGHPIVPVGTTSARVLERLAGPRAPSCTDRSGGTA